MGIDSSDDQAPDWATIAVYTCTASCETRPPGEMRVGSRVEIVGLGARPELNGIGASVLGWHEPSGRWQVACDSGERVRVKEANLAAVGGETAGYAEEYVWVQAHV